MVRDERNERTQTTKLPSPLALPEVTNEVNGSNQQADVVVRLPRTIDMHNSTKNNSIQRD